MKTWQLELRSDEGALALCQHMSCGYRCCDFQQAGEIAIYPGELEAVAANGHSIGHLEVIDAEYYGGKRVRCRAKDTATCDGGYKPLDCSSYPFFPKFSSNGDQRESVLVLTKGIGCPIAPDQISPHGEHVRATWLTLMTERPAVLRWLKAIWTESDDLDVERFQPVGF